MHPPPSNLHAVSPNRYHTTFTTSGAGGESVELRGEGQRQCQLADVSDTNNDSNTLTSNDLLHRGIGLPVVDLMASVVGISSLGWWVIWVGGHGEIFHNKTEKILPHTIMVAFPTVILSNLPYSRPHR